MDDAPRTLHDAGSRNDDVAPPERELAVQWAIGCLVAAVALIGVVLLCTLVALYLQPPPWVQIVLGIVLALGGVLLAWLVATAWGRAARARARSRGSDQRPDAGP